MRAKLRLALFAAAAAALAGCATAEDYLTNVNPFRRQDQAAPRPPAAGAPAGAPAAREPSAPQPPPRPSEPAR